MEIKSTRHNRKLMARACIIVIAVLSMFSTNAQNLIKKYTIRNGRMYIELSRQVKGSSLDSFITRYELRDIGLVQFMYMNDPDSLVKCGWQVEQNSRKEFIISKPLAALDDINDPAERIVFAEKHPTFKERFPVVNNGTAYGYNRFRHKNSFQNEKGTILFFLRDHQNARKVMLAGNFNDWNPQSLAMTKTDSGWIVPVKLSPGKYWYKFITDGSWITDNENQISENDGLGNTNSVFYVPNMMFVFNGHQDARKVYLAGSFNNWRAEELQMTRTSSGWQVAIYLPEGTHSYKFVADGRWYTDDHNHNRLPDGNGGYNSFVSLGKPHLFQLKGYANAQRVNLTGSFNGWNESELSMNKTVTGWELPYTLGPGNYEYKFKVDGKWISDPANPLKVPNEDQSGNSFLIIEPNYTFRLKGYSNAHQVSLAGDFNNWEPGLFTMKHEGGEWTFSVHLSAGKHLYKFIVDGKWIIDPENKLWEQNEFDTGNSIIWIEN